MNAMLLTVDSHILPQVRFIGQIHYRQPWTHFERCADEYILYVIHHGDLYLREHQTDYHLRHGDFIFLRPGVTHVGTKPSRCEYTFVHFRHDGLRVDDLDLPGREILLLAKRREALTSDPLTSDFDTASQLCVPHYDHISHEPLLAQLHHLLREAIDDYARRYEDYKLFASLKLQEILILLSRAFTTNQIQSSEAPVSRSLVRVQAIIDFIHREYTKKLDSETFADAFESDYDYLNRIFRHHTGYTILSYVNLVRIQRAMELIHTTPIKFAEIGYLVGLDDPYHFSKLFKKYTGLTPTQFSRKNIKTL